MLSRSAILLAALLCVGLAGCASNEDAYAPPPSAPLPEPSQTLALNNPQKPLQCVPYAREHSDVKLYGDAWTWWDQAAGKFPRSSLPATGAVMVLTGYAGPERGHVAVVRTIVSAREIRIDHANWLDDGAIYLNDPVEDVSADNDWSKVRVYNIKTGGWGKNIYPVQGFIDSPAAPPPDSPPDGALVLSANLPTDIPKVRQ